MVAIDAIKDNSEIIFISGLNLHKCPEVVQIAIATDEADGPTPVIVAFDAALEKRLGIVPYFDMKDSEGFTKIKAALADHRGVVQKTKGIKKRPQPESWTSRGRTIQATYVTSTEAEVTLRLSGGNQTTMPISKLSKDGQNRVAELAAE